MLVLLVCGHFIFRTENFWLLKGRGLVATKCLKPYRVAFFCLALYALDTNTQREKNIF